MREPRIDHTPDQIDGLLAGDIVKGHTEQRDRGAARLDRFQEARAEIDALGWRGLLARGRREGTGEWDHSLLF